MRKCMAWLAAAALGGSLLLFSACGLVGGPVNNDGTISGNYRPATDIEFLQVVDSIRQDKVFGDVGADEWNFGLEYATDRLVSLRSGETNWKEKENAFYRLVLEKGEEEEALQMRGSGYDTSVRYAPAGVYADGGVQLYEDESVCNDELYLYRDQAVRWQGLPGAEEEGSLLREPLGASSVDAVQGVLFGLPVRLMEDIVSVAKGGDAEGTLVSGMTWQDALLLREKLESYGITLEVDLSDGVKLRLSASEETVRLVLAGVIAAGVGEEIADTEALAQALPVRFVQCSYDIYFAVDADGVFSGIGVRADIEAVIEGVSYDLATGLPLEEDAEAGEIRLTVRGMERLSVYGGDVTLPDGLAGPAPSEEEETGGEELPEQPAEDAEEDAAGDAEDVPVLPTAEQFRATFAEAFETLWKEIYAAVQQAAEGAEAELPVE